MIKKFLLLSVVVLCSMFAVAQQLPDFTESAVHACNQQVCNGMPLDQGGVWQFILANDAFSINQSSATNPNGFFIFGNPGNDGTGGIDPASVQDNTPNPPRINGAVGPEGTLKFNWSAVDFNTRTIHYTGHVEVIDHQVEHCNQHGCWRVRVVDLADIYIDSVQ